MTNIKELEEKAAKDDSVANYDLGLVYAFGKNTARDLDKAEKYLTKATELVAGPQAYFNLAAIIAETEQEERYASAIALTKIAAISIGDKKAGPLLQFLQASANTEQIEAADQIVSQYKSEKFMTALFHNDATTDGLESDVQESVLKEAIKQVLAL